MIRLPKGVTLYIGGRIFRDEIPEEICPDHLKPKSKPKSDKK